MNIKNCHLHCGH